MKQFRVAGLTVPVPLALGVLCWLIPGIIYGLGIFVRSLFIPAEIRDSGYFGSGFLLIVAVFTLIALGLPILMVYRLRAARILLTGVAVLLTAAVSSRPSLEPLPAYIPVLAGTVLMWLPSSNRYLAGRRTVGDGAQL